ncbi:indolepyruvate ferredoxin oxidoreductase subunit alpha [candidate division KSB1 bacterium]
MKTLLSGNEAVARGAYEAGVEIAAAYPGTPSTEIMEHIAAYKEIYAEWSVNEKVAFEVAFGGALGGKRGIAAMKHVGVNVASDALMTVSYTGINGGLVIVSADDPGMHSSQNEQDNRYYAKMALIPMLEPSSSQEAKDFTITAFEISEKYDTPVLLRLTTRISHGKGIVELKDRCTPPERAYKKNEQKYVMIPAYARFRREKIVKRLLHLEEYSETFKYNSIEINDTELGIISSGIPYQYAKEVFPNASFLKLGMTYPLPEKTLKKFAEQVKKIYVIEELEPYLEEQIRALGIVVTGKEVLPRTGELSPELIKKCLSGNDKNKPVEPPLILPKRPPVMCPGCSHRGVFYVLKKMKAIVSGDIGCYTLSTLPPLETMDTCICMGASIGMAQGLRRTVGTKQKKRTVAVLGDSTFIHSGIPSLVNAVYNQTNITVVILDNRTTAMTGHQENPGTGKTLKGKNTPVFDFEGVAKAVGVNYVRIVDPMNIKETEKTIKEACSQRGVSVVISQRTCVLLDRKQFSGPLHIDIELCNECELCLRLGCPAISLKDGKLVIDSQLCNGCGLCAQVCNRDAILPEK